MSYILSLDQGTSSSRAIAFRHDGTVAACRQKEFRQIFPASGWVEHDPLDIWQSQKDVALEVLSELGALGCEAIGIANQRETTLLWDALTGEPVCNAIVWQDRRTSEDCARLAAHEDVIRRKTGLLPDPYFSASKLKWMLDNVPGAAERAAAGELRFGTVDSWLVWKLTGGAVHATDVSNASRTMLLNINTLDWDDELLELFGIPRSVLPEVRSSADDFGEALLGGARIPIRGVLGDQQAALLGQRCIEPGMVKNTYGTGCFLLMNCGDRPPVSANRLLTTVAWRIGGRTCYALEGSVFTAGSVVRWLRDGLHLIEKSADVEALAASVSDNGGVYFVPALTGLGAPYWDSDARGLICGLSRGTTAGHIARAALESIAFQTMDIARAMEKDAGVKLSRLKVDGGACANNLLMQFQADVLGAQVVRPRIIETTALGAAYAARIGCGTIKMEDLALAQDADRVFTPSAGPSEISAAVCRWHDAVRRTVLPSTLPNGGRGGC